METKDYAPIRLRTEVVEAGLCPLCGGCVAGCPYLGVFNGRVVQLDNCTTPDGTCYGNCPRTLTSLDEINQAVFGEGFGATDLGTVRAAYLARSTDPAVREASGTGGVAASLLASALDKGLIDAVVTTTQAPDERGALLSRNVVSSITLGDRPTPAMTSDRKQVIGLSTAPARFARVLAAFNSIPKNSAQTVGMTCLPCQVTSVRKRVGTAQPNRAGADSIGLLIAESCATKRWLEPGEDRQRANKACSFCWDYSGEFSDVSVSGARGSNKGWDIVLVRTEAGERAFKAAVDGGAIEAKPLPDDVLEQERKASRDKKKRALSNIVEKTGSVTDLLYLDMPRMMVDTLLKEAL